MVLTAAQEAPIGAFHGIEGLRTPTMKIPLQIETEDPRLAWDMVGRDGSLQAGTIIDLPGGVRLEFSGMVMRRAVDVPAVLEFIAEVATQLDVGLLAAWLYDKMRQRPGDRLVVRKRVITEITSDGIRQVLEEEFRVGEADR